MIQIFVKLNTADSDTGPFMVYSNVDGYITAYGINITKANLTNGVTVTVPDFTTSVKIRSNGKCTNSIIVNIAPAGSTTTTTTVRPSSTTTSSTTTSSTTTTTTSGGGQPGSTTTSSTSTSSTTTSTTIPSVLDCTCQKSVFNPPDGQSRQVSYYPCEINPKTCVYSLVTETIAPGAERCINISPSAITLDVFLFTPISGSGCPTCGPTPTCTDVNGCKTWTFSIPIDDAEGVTYRKCDGTLITVYLSGVYCICGIPVSTCVGCIALNAPNTNCKS